MIPLPGLLLGKFNFGSFAILVGIIILLICSSFFSASETAFSTSNNIRLRNYADEKRKGARRALWIVENYDRALSTILVGNNFVNIASTTLCAYLLGVFITSPTVANLINTVVMTIIVLIFGEILPKSIAKQSPEKVALKFSGVMYFLIKLLTPVCWVFIKLQKLFVKNKTDDNPTVTEDELESIIDTMEEEGVLESYDADLFQGVMDLNDKTVYDVMTPRVDVVALNKNASEQEINELFLDSEFSRVPIYDGDKDHMIGVLYQKDYFKNILKKEPFKLSTLITEPLYVAENMKVKELIKSMQSEKKHMAIVVDEHGGTSGIVTLEDALEEMVGEIYDEQDDEEQLLIKKIDDKTYELSPEIDLFDLFKELQIEHLPQTQYSTLGGLLYELAENLPNLHQKLEVVTIDEQLADNGEFVSKTVKLIFEILKLEDMRIKRVLLTVVENPEDEENEIGNASEGMDFKQAKKRKQHK